MIVRSLPNADNFRPATELPVYSDHILFTQPVPFKYDYPEHKTEFGLVSCKSGKGNFILNRRKYVVDEKSYLVVNRYSDLAIGIKEQNSEPSLLFFHSILPAIVFKSLLSNDEALLDHRVETGADFSLLERVHAVDTSLRSVLDHLPLLGYSSASFHALKADLLVRSILERLCLETNAAIKVSSNISAIKRSTRMELYKRLATARDWMEEHYASPITLDDMAAVAMMNSQHFLRKFREAYSVTPYQYLTSVRLKRAKILLATTDEPVASVCVAVGFESPTYFTGLFHKKFTTSPGKFRRSAKPAVSTR